MKSNQADKEREIIIIQNENTPRKLSNIIKNNNIHIIGTLEGEGRKKKAESLLEDIAKTFLNVEKKTETQVQDAKRVVYKINQRRSTSRHIAIKQAKKY